MHQRLPVVIQPLVEGYVARLKEVLPEISESFYIVGSIALGEFNPLYSDIDFVMVITRDLSAAEIERLGHLHRDIEDRFPRWKMSGSYVRAPELGKLTEKLGAHLHYHDGRLRIQQHNELNPVTWWELKHNGLTLFGTPPEHLDLTIDRDTLIAWMMNNLNSYWVKWTLHPIRILMLYSDWGIQWVVTGVLRQFYTFREGSITTKMKASEYALCHVPARWQRIIQEAIDIRRGERKSAYRFRIVRMMEAVDFLRFIIQVCNIDYVPT